MKKSLSKIGGFFWDFRDYSGALATGEGKKAFFLGSALM